jgi:mannose-6-phosphate isomerase-like protein (cupin superfamily)
MRAEGETAVGGTDRPCLRREEEIPEETVGDGSLLRQIFHPANHPVRTGHSLSRARLVPGRSTLQHALAQSETYYFLSGQGTLVLDGQDYPVTAGSACWVPPGCRQSLRNEGEGWLEFLVIMDPPWTAAGDSAEESGKVDRPPAVDPSPYQPEREHP